MLHARLPCDVWLQLYPSLSFISTSCPIPLNLQKHLILTDPQNQILCVHCNGNSINNLGCIWAIHNAKKERVIWGTWIYKITHSKDKAQHLNIFTQSQRCFKAFSFVCKSESNLESFLVNIQSVYIRTLALINVFIKPCHLKQAIAMQYNTQWQLFFKNNNQILPFISHNRHVSVFVFLISRVALCVEASSISEKMGERWLFVVKCFEWIEGWKRYSNAFTIMMVLRELIQSQANAAAS